MGGIFISYRRDDSRLYAGRLRDALSHHFGAQVFQDIDTINPDERFSRVIEQAVESCDALLALIGPTWLSTDDAGQRRLDDPEDYVRLEIAAALGRSDLLVIPVLVGPTSMPAAADLPKPLASLAERNALALSDENWDDQVARLTRALEKVVKPRVVAPGSLHLDASQAEVGTAGPPALSSLSSETLRALGCALDIVDTVGPAAAVLLGVLWSGADDKGATVPAELLARLDTGREGVSLVRDVEALRRDARADPTAMSDEQISESPIGRIVVAAESVRDEVFDERVHRRHLLAAALGEPRTAFSDPVVERALGLPLSELRGALREIIARKYGPDDVWNALLAELAIRDHVEWVADTPARRDYLNRKPVAVMLARRLRRIAAQEGDGGSFLVHLDGAWGTGKSSILNFLREELEDRKPPWMVVEINAWQQSRLGPAWWALLAALRRRLAMPLGARRRWSLRLREAYHRVRLTGAPYVLAIGFVFALAAALVLAVGPSDVRSWDPEQIAKGVIAVLTAIATVWTGALVASRFMLWDSVLGARLFESSNRNPMAYLREHFGWLVAEAGRTVGPVVFFVDDLDRCDHAYVVELLDGIQTIVRDAGGAAIGGPYFVIAADGEWIRASYLHQHEAMASALREPGQTLGDLFLDKIFQLTVTMPSLSTARQADYFKRLLASGPADASAHQEERDRVESRIRRSRTQAEVHDAWRSASPDVREEVASLAVDKLTERAVEAETEHELEKFAFLLDRNPRRIKRFLNTYTADLVTLGLEDNFLDPDALAIWTILRMRWPTLAAYLRERPDAIEYAHRDDLIPDNFDPGLRRILHFVDVRDLIDCPHGGPLTVDLVERLTRGATRKPEGRVAPEPTLGVPDVGSTGR